MSKKFKDGEDPDELIKYRFLCRKGGLLFVGQTGIGKSSMSMQLGMHLVMGRSFQGLEPTRPLKILLIQAENDDGDLAEMRDGIIEDMNLSEADMNLLNDNFLYYSENGLSGAALTEGLLPALLEKNPVDIVIIDPALAYIDGDSSSQRDVGNFLRKQLNPVLTKFNVAAMIIHHTGKPRSEKVSLNFTDHAYAGVGSSEWSNWARAVISLQGSQWEGVYVFRAAKRGPRLRWQIHGKPCYVRLMKHDDRPGIIKWHELTEAEVSELDQSEAGGEAKKDKPENRIRNEMNRAKSLIPADECGAICRQELLDNICLHVSVGMTKAKRLLDLLEVEKHVKTGWVTRPDRPKSKTYWLSSELDLTNLP